jgi:hypothetical protein
MTTLYSTPRGSTYDPLPVDVWPYDGAGPAYRLDGAEKVVLTWADRETSTGEFDVALTANTAPLLACDGRYLLVGDLNGHRHLSVPVVAEAYNDGDGGGTRVSVTTAGPWALLQGQRVPPVPGRPIDLQGEAEHYVLEGPVETVVKTLLQVGVDYTGHPIVVTDDLGRGPVVRVISRFDTVAELVAEALAGTGYRLDLAAWLPGDDDAGWSLDRPSVVADVVPYRVVDGLTFSADADDLASWRLEHTRATEDRVIVGDDEKGVAQAFTYYERAPRPASPWARRDGFMSLSSDEVPDAAAVVARHLDETAATTEAVGDVAPAGVWEYGNDGQYGLQYSVGDFAVLDLGLAGVVDQVVTEVTAELTPTTFTVTPTVSTPDTKKRDLYSTVVDLEQRVARQEKN